MALKFLGYNDFFIDLTRVVSINTSTSTVALWLFSLNRRSSPTSSAPGSIAKSGAARDVCSAILPMESPGIRAISAATAASDAKSPAKCFDEGTLGNIPTRGKRVGASAMPVATRGREHPKDQDICQDNKREQLFKYTTNLDNYPNCYVYANYTYWLN